MIIKSKAIPLPIDNIDTDQILPAKYLLKINKTGYGEHLFENWRYEADGRTPKQDFILNDRRYAGAQILISGDSFGAGSSREHAVWAIKQFGFEVVIAPSFSDIFKNNAFGNGLLLVTVDRPTYTELIAKVTQNPDFQIEVDLESQKVTTQDGTIISFEINQFVKEKLLKGLDDISYILSKEDLIKKYESEHI